MKHLGQVFLAVLSVGLLMWACGGEEPATGPQEASSDSVKIMAVPPERSAAITEPFQLKALRDPKGLGLAQRDEATLRLIADWPADTAWEKCQEQDGEHCKEQGQTYTGQYFVHCVSGECDPELPYTWELKTPPPGTTVSFNPPVTTIEQLTTMSIEVDNDAETGVFESAVAAPPSGPDIPFTFHTLCSWGLGTCPYIEIRDLMGVGYPSVSVSAAGEQSTLIGKRMHLKVQHKTGTGEHQFEQEEQEWLIQWDGQGDLVHGYDITATQLQLFPWPQDVGTKDTISYYHVEPNQYVVWATADLNYHDDEAEVGVLTKAVFNVNGPTNAQLVSVTDTVRFGPIGLSVYGMKFGKIQSPGLPPGISYAFGAIAPPNDNGYVAGTQLVSGNKQITNRAGGISLDWSSNGRELDGCPLYGAAVQKDPNGLYIWTSNDSPLQGFDAIDSLGHMNLDFRMYFMYRPGGFHSIWVPIGRLDWFANAAAARVGTPSVWQPVSSSWSVNPSTAGSYPNHPTWVEVEPSDDPCPSVPANLVASARQKSGEPTQLGQEVSP
jgi:hypothetical protein